MDQRVNGLATLTFPGRRHLSVQPRQVEKMKKWEEMGMEKLNYFKKVSVMIYLHLIY
jgi:hypothetical protein